MEREELYYRILCVDPSGKFSFFPVSEIQKLPYNIIIDNWALFWNPENITVCPTVDQIMRITLDQINDYKDAEKKNDFYAQSKRNLALIASYEIKKSIDPTINFEQYVDGLQPIPE